MYTKSTDKYRVAVIGGGASGMLFAGMLTSLSENCTVTVFEKSKAVLRKLAITGKGRCNLTNDAPPEEIMKNVISNPRFLYGALNQFTPEDVKALFEGLGVPLVTERGRRVFPASSKAYDIVDALKKYAKRAEVRTSCPVFSLTKTENGFTVESPRGKEDFDCVLVATGGLSYKLTGSDGDGMRFAESLGHSIIPCRASLVPIEARDKALCAEMMGLSLKNVALKIEGEGKKPLYEDFGEMLFTHFGLSGPMILSASAHIRDKDISSLTAYIDLKPALDEQTLDSRLVSDFKEMANKDYINVLAGLLPSKMTEVFARMSKIDGHRKANSITKEERRGILELLKRFPIRLSRLRDINEAVITAGGVSTKEINPKTMESKLIPVLYFAGETIDIDALTGGYNLQLAFSTAAAAARAVAERAAENTEYEEVL